MSHVLSTTVLAVALFAMAAFPGQAAPKSDDPLAVYRWKARVLVALAPDPNDPKLARQRQIYEAMKAGANERDLALVEAIGTSPEARALRRTFAVDAGFHAVLVGKDGGSKLASSDPLGPDQLFPLIDAMPMRQSEMRTK